MSENKKGSKSGSGKSAAKKSPAKSAAKKTPAKKAEAKPKAEGKLTMASLAQQMSNMKQEFLNTLKELKDSLKGTPEIPTAPALADKLPTKQEEEKSARQSSGRGTGTERVAGRY